MKRSILASSLDIKLLLAVFLACTVIGTTNIQAQSPSVPEGGSDNAYDCSQNDWGLYWYGLGDVGVKSYQDGRDIPGYYDHTKPTILFIHGWTSGFVERGTFQAGTTFVSLARQTFKWTDVDPSLELSVSDQWIQNGWNVGIYHWTQFADDLYDVLHFPGSPLYPEGKIYSVSGPGQMRWRRCSIIDPTSNDTTNGNYVLDYDNAASDMPSVPVSQLLLSDYEHAMSKYTGPTVRWVGQSLGAQLALLDAYYLWHDSSFPKAAKPQRIALTDPYWTPVQYGATFPYYPLGAQTAGQLGRILAADLKANGVVLERTKTSAVNDINVRTLVQLLTGADPGDQYTGDPNPDFDTIVGRTDYNIQFLGAFNQGDFLTNFQRPQEWFPQLFNRHGAAYRLYFVGNLASSPPAECTSDSGTSANPSCTTTGAVAGSALTSDDRAKAMMNLGGIWEQVDGTRNWYPSGIDFACTTRCGYTIFDTGVLVPGGDSYLWGINDAGEAVGQATGSDNLQHLVIYSQGSLRDFGTLNGQDTIGLSINNNSQIGGYSHGPEATSSLGFIYDRSHGLFNSVTLAGNQTSVVNQYALNNSGAYAGDYVDRSDNAKTLRVYTGNGAGTPTPLALPTGKSWGAFSINDSGVIAGFGGANVNSLQPYLLTSPTPSALALPTGDIEGFAIGISGNSVVGATWSDPEKSHAVKWDARAANGVTSLNLQAATQFSRAIAVNSTGDAVGFARDTPGGQQYAAYWSRGNLVNLNDVVEPASGWQLLSATGINNNGFIAGYGRYGGAIHGFLLSPLPVAAR